MLFRQVRSGCSSVRLEYASGGRGVASSNLVTPTTQRSADSPWIIGTLFFLETLEELEALETLDLLEK